MAEKLIHLTTRIPENLWRLGEQRRAELPLVRAQLVALIDSLRLTLRGRIDPKRRGGR